VSPRRTEDYFDERSRPDLRLGHGAVRPRAVEPAVDFLADLAGSGRALERGIGTSRIALPLSQRGVDVHGIDLSEAMVAQLNAKPGASAIGITLGDFASTKVEGTFRLAYLVYNTIENLTNLDEQVQCFRNVGRHLEPGGSFVVEVGGSSAPTAPPGEKVCAFKVTPTHLGVGELDTATRRGVSHHYRARAGNGGRSRSRFDVWPSELDLVISGLQSRNDQGYLTCSISIVVGPLPCA
jgi:SAM-dependent methyltransferase